MGEAGRRRKRRHCFGVGGQRRRTAASTPREQEVLLLIAQAPLHIETYLLCYLFYPCALLCKTWDATSPDNNTSARANRREEEKTELLFKNATAVPKEKHSRSRSCSIPGHGRRRHGRDRRRRPAGARARVRAARRGRPRDRQPPPPGLGRRSGRRRRGRAAPPHVRRPRDAAPAEVRYKCGEMAPMYAQALREFGGPA